MSGGAYDYLYYKMEQAAETLTDKSQPHYRKLFGKLMFECAKAMRTIEWVDSGDKDEGEDEPAIFQCFKFINDVELKKREKS